ncbi:bifunctional tetrahydrofolate synthase/dihydrofolate synthase [Alteromonas sp. CYL-A6]|uniref:bifunctional tetrahydrofolate synthase/dihydrofolate synthase n=1 Tax=Alteromonas nitratireducens TaxID=3390813 RepID=UPI0034AC7FCB
MSYGNKGHSAPGRSLADWLTYLESIHPTAIDMGLERVARVADIMGLSLQSTVITVAGTNGKGTTCRLLERILLSQGKSVGVYSSPHLLDYRERVRLNDALPDEQVFCDAFSAVEQARGDISLTYFEFGTLAAIYMLMQARPDVVLLEVGLGGRLDATNIIDPDLAVITTIGLDHQAWLGDTREAIATEKAGIMRPMGKVVVGETDPPETLKDAVSRLNTDCWWAGDDFDLETHGDTWSFTCQSETLNDLPRPNIPLQNAATALTVLKKLNWLEDNPAFRQTLATTSLPGRCQQIDNQPAVVVDVAHNPQSVGTLKTWLDSQAYRHCHIVVGMLSDKAIEDSLAVLRDVPANWYAGTTAGPRGLSGAALASALRAVGVSKVQVFDTITEAYQCARAQCPDDGMILVFGSFLTVADVLALHSENKLQ